MTDVQAQLTEARQKLAAFEEEIDGGDVLGRLRAMSPFHPLLIARGMAIAGTIGAVLVALGVLAAPMVFSREVATTLVRMEAQIGFSLPLVIGVVAGCFSSFGIAVHQLAVVVARNAPLLPDQAKQHQRLMARIKQLEAQAAVGLQPAGVAYQRY